MPLAQNNRSETGAVDVLSSCHQGVDPLRRRVGDNGLMFGLSLAGQRLPHMRTVNSCVYATLFPLI